MGNNSSISDHYEKVCRKLGLPLPIMDPSGFHFKWTIPNNRIPDKDTIEYDFYSTFQEAMGRRGHEYISWDETKNEYPEDKRAEPLVRPDINLVLNFGSLEEKDPDPMVYKLRNPLNTRVLTVYQMPGVPEEEVLRTGYNGLLLNMCSLALGLIQNKKTARLFELNQGHPEFRWSSPQTLEETLIKPFIDPKVGAEFSMGWKGADVLKPELYTALQPTREQIIDGGKKLHRLELLPNPADIEGLVGPKGRRFVEEYIKITGLSYGNIAQAVSSDMCEEYHLPIGSFCVSASGVDKSNLKDEQVLLVIGSDNEGNMVVWTREGENAFGRPSVDSLEQWLIFRLGADAYVHFHGVVTELPESYHGLEIEIPWPCGTEQLSVATAAAIYRAKEEEGYDPNRLYIRQAHHGSILTGSSIEYILNILDQIKDYGILRGTPNY